MFCFLLVNPTRLSVLVFVLFVLDRGSKELLGYQVSVGNQDHRLAMGLRIQDYCKMLKCGCNAFLGLGQSLGKCPI